MKSDKDILDIKALKVKDLIHIIWKQNYISLNV